MNQRRVRGQAGPGRAPASRPSASVSSSTAATSAIAAVEAGPGGEQHVEEAVVLEAGLRVAVPQRVVQPGGALERQLAVERGRRCSAASSRGVGKASAVTPPVRSLSR